MYNHMEAVRVFKQKIPTLYTVQYVRVSLYENVEVLTLYSKLKSGIINAPLYKLQYFCHVLHYERKNFAHILDILDILSISKM